MRFHVLNIKLCAEKRFVFHVKLNKTRCRATMPSLMLKNCDTSKFLLQSSSSQHNLDECFFIMAITPNLIVAYSHNGFCSDGLVPCPSIITRGKTLHKREGWYGKFCFQSPWLEFEWPEAFLTSTDADCPSLWTEDHINDIKVALERFIPVSIELISSKRSMSTWKRKTQSFLRPMEKKVDEEEARKKVGSKMTVRKENREGQLDLLEVCFCVVSPMTGGADGKSTQQLGKTIYCQQHMAMSHFSTKSWTLEELVCFIMYVRLAGL